MSSSKSRQSHQESKKHSKTGLALKTEKTARSGGERGFWIMIKSVKMRLILRLERNLLTHLNIPAKEMIWGRTLILILSSLRLTWDDWRG